MKLSIQTNKELRVKKAADLENYIAQLKKSQAELNHALYTGKETTTHQVRLIKKAIARAHLIHTQLKLTTMEKDK